MIVGLTGGIGSGKSTICQIFRALGVPVISADTIARDIVDTNQAVLDAIIAKFGKTYLDKNLQLDRAKLRQQIFTSTQDRRWLEQLLHPMIAVEIKRLTAQSTYPYCIVEIPLLVEANMQDLVDRILTVVCPEEVQIQRVMERYQYNASQAQAMIATQLALEQRLATTDDVLENDLDLEALNQQVLELHRLYLSLAT